MKTPGSSMLEKLLRGIVVSALLITATLKFVSCLGDAPLLASKSPVLEALTIRQEMGIGAAVEFVVAVFMATSRSSFWSGLAGLWFSTLVILYRASKIFLGSARPCVCLGNSASWLGISEQTADMISLWIILIILLLSLALCGAGRLQMRLQSKFVAPLFLLIPILCVGQEPGSKTIVFSGVISNTFVLPDFMHEEGRTFRVTVNGSDSSLDITNSANRGISHAAFKGGEYSYYYQGPFTNSKGVVSMPIAARIDAQKIPRDDGSWINYLWLAFASHSYFTSRTDYGAIPIWATGLKSEDTTKMGTKAFYSALPGSPYPLEVSYVSDGCDYFYGRTAGVLQRVRLPSPLGVGYTNFVERTVATTNFNGLVLPSEVLIYRFAPVRGSHTDGHSLRLLVESHIWVNSIGASDSPPMHPEFAGVVGVRDSRLQDGTRKNGILQSTMTNGAWPTLQQAKKRFQIRQEMLERTRLREAANKWKRKYVLAAFLLIGCAFPLAVIVRFFKSRLNP